MDIGAWLRGLGLGQYETTFRESEIDAEVLPDLTEADLDLLGVPLGHRKRLLKAIADLGSASRRQDVEPRACIVAYGRRRAPSDHRDVL
jgi:SAM (Sterile alpha motif) domain-containing protein